MSELYYEFYLESLENIKKLKKELAPLLEPLEAQIDELNKKINYTEKELKEIKSQQKLCSKKITDIKSNHTKDILAYMQEKIRNERTGQKQIVQIDDDSEIIAIHKRKNDMLQEQEEMIKKYDEQAEAKKAYVSQMKSELKPILEKRDRVAKPLKKEEESRDTWLWAYKRDLEKEAEATSFDNKDFTDTHSSYSSSYFSSSYEPSYSSSNSYEQNKYSKDHMASCYKTYETKSSTSTNYKPAPSHTVTNWYLIEKQGRKICVEVVSHSNNVGAAKRDMMALYGLSTSDIKLSSGGSRNPYPTHAHNYFDGTNSH